MTEIPPERGILAERYVRNFLSLPFVTEFVFHSPQTITGGIHKEVADLLITYPGVGILISQKTQHDPLTRTPEKTLSWALKEAKKAASQLCGALRTARGKPVWCDHARRGRVEFADGLPPINHGIVLVEVFEHVDLNAQADHLPLRYQETSITYLSLNDFLNIAIELRTVPELLSYLEARRALSEAELRIIADERVLFEFYLLQDGSFAGYTGKSDAASVVAARHTELEQILKSKREYDQYSKLLEHVADQLAARRQDYATGLSPEALARYDAPTQRTNYLKMQTVLANMGLRERSELARAFLRTIHKCKNARQGFTYGAIHFDSLPEWVFVVGSCAGLKPAELHERMQSLMAAAMTFFRKTQCLLIIDREKVSYEVGFCTHPSPPSSPTEHAIGNLLFGHLKMTDCPITFIPGGELF